MVRHPATLLHAQPTGQVFLRDYDKGVVTSLGGQLGQVEGRDQYTVQIPTLKAGEDLVPIIVKTPEQEIQWNQFPRIVVSCDDIAPALVRWNPITEEYRVASGSPTAGVGALHEITPDGIVPLPLRPPSPMGPVQNEVKIQAWPFDLTYTVEVWHRYRNWAILMLYHVMKTFPPYGKVSLVDSLTQERTYDTFMEGGPKDLTEALSLTDRGSGYAHTIRITGELDLSDPELLSTVRTINTGVRAVTERQDFRPNQEIQRRS